MDNHRKTLALESPRIYRILIVDDEEGIRLTLKFGLQKIKGYEIETTCNGLEALQILERSLFDLVITDYMMPEMNGLTLLGHIQKNQPDMPVILISAYQNQLIEKQATDGTIQHFLHKPVSLKTIRQLVSEVLQIE